MQRSVWILAIAMAIQAAPWAVVGAATPARPDDSEAASTDALAHDYLRAATSDASALSRLALAGALQFLSAPGMPPSSITEAQWRPIRDRALRDGKDDAMVQAVFLMGNRHSMNDIASRDYAVEMLTRHLGQNGNFGLVLLSLPEVSGEAQVERDILHQAARAKTFDSTYTAVQHALAQDLAGMQWTRPSTPLKDLPDMADDVQSAMISHVIAAVGAISPIGPVVKLCKSAAPEVRSDCQLLGQRLFKDAETAIDITMSLYLIDLSAPDDLVRQQVANERRRFAWQSEQLQTIWAGGQTDSPAIRQHLERQRRLTELEAMRETLAALNLPLEPPAGWKSRSERYEADTKAAAPKTPR